MRDGSFDPKCITQFTSVVYFRIDMERTFTYNTEPADGGRKVLAFLRARGYSHHILGGLKPYADAVLRNGKPVRMSDQLRAGDTLTVTLRDEEPSENILAVPVPFSIVYEDEDIMVIDKPAGISIHPAPGHPADTLANGIAWHYAQKGIPYVFRCINRLDRDTTGLLILANNALASAVLTEDLQRRAIHRTYLAIACGETPEEGTIELPIGRKEGSLVERCVDEEKGQRAVTHYKKIRDLGEPASEDIAEKDDSALPSSRLSLLELRLETGRTHQIRVHMASIGHPLLGDTLYGDPEPSALIGRQALHSWKLEFIHPITKEEMQFTAPLPDDMSFVLN